MSLTTVPAHVEYGFTHHALFYRGAQDYLDGTVPFIEAGLADGEPVAVAVPTENLYQLRSALGGAAEQVRMLDMTEAGRNPGRIIPAVLRDFADAHPGQHVRIIGEPIWPGRSVKEYPACAQHEALINLAFEGRWATIRCPYDTGGLDDRALADARATHPILEDSAGRRSSSDYDALRVMGDYNQPLGLTATVNERAFEVTTLTAVRRFAVDHAQQCGLPADRVMDLELAVGELTANSISYGGGTGVLRAWADDEHVIYEVCDAGCLTDPLAGRLPAADSQLGGRGLLLVNNLVDLVRVYTSQAGTTTRIHLRRH